MIAAWIERRNYSAHARYDLLMRKVLFLFTGLLLAQGTGPPPGMQCPQRTLVTWETGANWDKRQQFAPAHFAYMARQMKSGAVISAGPMVGLPKATGVFASADWAQVEAILNDEPFTREGVLKVAEHAVWNACEAAR